MPAALSSATLGYPRVGRNREMKKALESHWGAQSTAADLHAVSEAVLVDSLRAQHAAGVARIAVGDHTLYDPVLDWTRRLGCVPPRFAHLPALDRYFAMARGVDDAPALDLSKFFGTNYHYLVPEIDAAAAPRPDFADFLDMIRLAQDTVGNHPVVPLVLGPVTYVHLAKLEGVEAKDVLAKLLPVYAQLLAELKAMGVKEVMMQEPALVLTEAAEMKDLYQTAYKALAEPRLPLHVVTFFDSVDPAVLSWVVALPGINGLSLDFTRGNNLAALKEMTWPNSLRLGAGVVDGRSVWTDADTAPPMLAAIREAVGDGVEISVQPSCSLHYVPIDVECETDIPKEIRSRLSFAVQKLDTVVALAKQPAGSGAKGAQMDQIVQDAITDALDEELFVREPKFERRRPQQFSVPGGFGTTTIGSFPQTKEIRRVRTQFKKGNLSEVEYHSMIDKQIGFCIGVQEALGLDVFVHGECERSDMVEYFGVKLTGFAFTKNGWVQSFGSRYVRPPIITGDVSRTGPMTVREFKIAQGMTEKPVKGMLTGATTILNWSFPRKDISHEKQAYQIGLALRDEVADLEAAGCKIIQVDDPALREGLPLKHKDWAEYLRWAVRAFRLSTSGVQAATQIVTHLCYADFEDILQAIDDMQADVLTIENSRSGDEMLRVLAEFGYARDIGPGVYDIHSPVVPGVDAVAERVALFGKVGLARERVWVNPDCGLKTRKWEQVIPALKNMVAAAEKARAK
ncbi:5-methyltetrahydropteroyltriglutamate--homocysteine methyltransferase [Chondrus crispus]|uniref:5-methyltetrahydropteroyltriglutamate--homocysteine S-methyltransferase n=1 Tax=Chondrus crispus TaxID=2769 RepID=R7Q9X0_CHOCR|nr:5-methyltetrahydropteroyltriglutamate--homocysteine methyltransferase [Chondrus crispus]CDF34201.1 5-methyltetrahydropteroyltriglutamate--homocysteine methyltransferase [Chondrus crispus]|eukprot:XP_005714020.1 5-methyltetrahydropteroyltriglutamate--homocysteine methyltransferase [Chondrus crispus]